MTSPGAVALMGRVILGATGEGDDWRTLRDHLHGNGWQVDLFDPTPRNDGSGPEAALPLLHGVDLAVLLATSPVRRLDSAANRQLAYLVRNLEASLGAEKVLFVRERDVSPLAEQTKVLEVDYEPGNIAMLFPRIMERLAESSVVNTKPLIAPWLERLGLVDRRPPPEVSMIVAAIFVLVFFFGIMFYWPNGSDPGPLSAEVAGPQITGDADAVSAGSGGIGAAENGAVFGISNEGGSVRGLPARCVIDTRNSLIVPEIVACEGVGGIQIQGHRGPWHNEIHLIRPDLGVVADAYMEVGTNTNGVRLVPTADNELEELGSTGGVEQLVLVFTADGQEVVIRQRAGRGGNVATVTFGIELG